MFLDFVEVRVASADDEGEGGEFDRILAGDGVDVSFQVIDGDEWDLRGGRKSFRVGDADQEGSDEAGSLRDGDGVEIGEGGGGFGGGEAWTAGTMARRCSREARFEDDTAVRGVGRHLRSDDGRENARAVYDDGGGGFIAGGFDAEDAH